MKPDLHLYTASTMNGWKPLIFLEEAGLDYELHVSGKKLGTRLLQRVAPGHRHLIAVCPRAISSGSRGRFRKNVHRSTGPFLDRRKTGQASSDATTDLHGTSLDAVLSCLGPSCAGPELHSAER